MNVKIIHLLLIQNALTTDSNISFFKLPFKKIYLLGIKIKRKSNSKPLSEY